MASHGKVLDLFDDRYLNLQDVLGNVEPFPSLVPYEQYVRSILVYQVDTNHEVYMALLQDFTDRYARSAQLEHKEAWTWCVQWEVDKPNADAPCTPAAKKPRLDPLSSAAQTNELTQRKPPAYTRIERRLLHPDMFQEEDMLRILIDIVQVDSKLVPNYIEFLYQWVDYYEGGGRALKAALRMEIPSLWLFEYHPLPLFDNDSDDMEEYGLEKAAEEMGERFTKRKKPLALEDMERLTEQSERLEYREVKFGIQRPINLNDEPLPPLINVPHDYQKRQQYYAACFKNRQRAFWLLQEAGVTATQIANYKKLQPMSPMNTPEDMNGDGWLNYYKEEPCAHAAFLDNQRMKELREKQREIAISNQLAEEARIAATTNTVNPNSLLPPALIPPTPGLPPPVTSGRPDQVAAWLARVKGMVNKDRDPPVKAVPPPMLGKPKSKVFKHAIARPMPTRTRWEVPGDEDTDNDDEDEDNYSNSDDIDPDEREPESNDAMDATSGLTPPQAPPIPIQPTPLSQPGPVAFPNIAVYLRSLNPTQLANLMPLLNPQAQAAIRRNNPELFTHNQVPQPQQPTIGGGIQSSATGPTNGTSTEVGFQPPFPPNLDAALPPSIPQSQQQLLWQRLAQMQSPHLPAAAHGSAAYPLMSSQFQAQIGLQQAQIQSQARPPPPFPMEAAMQAAAQSNPSSGYIGPPLSSAYTLGMGLSQPQTQQTAVPSGGAQATSSLSQQRSLPNMIVTPFVQQAIWDCQDAQGTNAMAGYLLGTQHIQAQNAPIHDHREDGHLLNSSLSASGNIPAITVTQPQTGSSVQGNGGPRAISPALQALLQSSRNIAPTTMPAQGQISQGQISLGQISLGQISPGQDQGPSSIPQPAPSSPASRLLPFPNEYASPRSPAVTSFALEMQGSNRAPPPPNLALQLSQPRHLTPPSAGLNHSCASLMTPLAGLTGNLSLASPQSGTFQATSPQAGSLQATSPHGIPIQIYLPQIVIGHDSNFAGATDCLILGYTHKGTGVLKLSKAIFFPTSIWENMLRRVQRSHAVVLETYGPPPNHPRYAAGKGILRNPDDVDGPHKFVYDKVSQVFGLMTGCAVREEEVTKRWRGPGAIVQKSLDGRRGFGLSEEEMAEKERRRREIDEILAEEEEDVSDEGEEIEERR
ncbi:uncharacterized protein N0V89_002411 [Didymosphaeria variabile]|uniref:Uncharacterized protein n=1 Tax=Didymosphaeria variabile TaxID=1932322 RepID=A0A9W8XRL3_9PLEO|nr:uncharacterized protein N0V89_002411 [Didymosphaeria variabile]KAJ4357835.1 hypothetical protein N0V89_002411 [Didymosphaeria variabile]